LIVVLCISTITLPDTCMPLYWEIFPNYNVVTNEVELYAKNNLNVNPVNKTAIKEGVKVVY
jgi:hypothetical protein